MPEPRPQRKPKILVVYNEGPDWTSYDLEKSKLMLGMMTDGLKQEGYTYATLRFYDDLSGLDQYDPREWLVWNWGEELAGQPWTEAEVAREFERRGFAYTGSAPEVIAFAQNRPQVKQKLAAAGLPTLPFRVFNDPAQAKAWTIYPAIVKGANQHASFGITGDSVVHNAAQLAARIEHLRDTYHDEALVEQFLDTREFHVAVWGNGEPEALPPTEFDYSPFEDIHDRLYTLDWKFDPESRGYKEIKNPCPAPADRPDWQARLMEIARQAYIVIGLRDFGRFDMRMLGDEPQILDCNPNPDLDPISVVLYGAMAKGMNYGQMVGYIIQLAAARVPQ